MSKKEQNKTLNQRLKRAQINDEAEELQSGTESDHSINSVELSDDHSEEEEEEEEEEGKGYEQDEEDIYDEENYQEGDYHEENYQEEGENEENYQGEKERVNQVNSKPGKESKSKEIPKDPSFVPKGQFFLHDDRTNTERRGRGRGAKRGRGRGRGGSGVLWESEEKWTHDKFADVENGIHGYEESRRSRRKRNKSREAKTKSIAKRNEIDDSGKKVQWVVKGDKKAEKKAEKKVENEVAGERTQNSSKKPMRLSISLTTNEHQGRDRQNRGQERRAEEYREYPRVRVEKRTQNEENRFQNKFSGTEQRENRESIRGNRGRGNGGQRGNRGGRGRGRGGYLGIAESFQENEMEGKFSAHDENDEYYAQPQHFSSYGTPRDQLIYAQNANPYQIQEPVNDYAVNMMPIMTAPINLNMNLEMAATGNPYYSGPNPIGSSLYPPVYSQMPVYPQSHPYFPQPSYIQQPEYTFKQPVHGYSEFLPYPNPEIGFAPPLSPANAAYQARKNEFRARKALPIVTPDQDSKIENPKH